MENNFRRYNENSKMKKKVITSANDEVPVVAKATISKLVNDPVKSAAAVNLVYVNGNEPGINRIKKGSSFSYAKGTNKIKDEEDLKRIKSLVIPPAWEEVWICALSNGHLQATGIDVLKRKQYRYHPHWSQLRSQTKFYHIYQFGKALPAIRQQLQKDLALQGLPADKVLATVVTLMERTNIRVGNSLYEKLYGSFGLTTLKDKHVSFDGNSIAFSFKGKKGVEHTISLKSKKLLDIVKKCRDIPGKELFQYYTEGGEKKAIDSGMVNNYIKTISGGDFTAKDFRTWAGTVHSLNALKELGMYESETEAKKKIAELFRIVSKELGNTPNVCKKYYVHPVIIDLYEKTELKKYIDKLEKDKSTAGDWLSAEEKVVMEILESN